MDTDTSLTSFNMICIDSDSRFLLSLINDIAIWTVTNINDIEISCPFQQYFFVSMELFANKLRGAFI